jgi:trimethylamine:corrinoid methyltransferase-like protein
LKGFARCHKPAFSTDAHIRSGFNGSARRVDNEATVNLRQRLESYEKPLIDESLEKELKDFVARKKAEILKT